jgi:predicted DNA binding CopG/RHH family protein
MKKPARIPTFKTESAEQAFWEAHDSSDFIDWSKAKIAHFASLKPSTKTISLRLPESLLNEIKILANKEDLPYQSLMKILLSQGIQNEHKKHRQKE